jgi:hypothetical protein
VDRAVAGAVPHVRNAADREVNMMNRKKSNLRLALILASIALVFFVSVIAQHL